MPFCLLSFPILLTFAIIVECKNISILGVIFNILIQRYKFLELTSNKPYELSLTVPSVLMKEAQAHWANADFWLPHNFTLRILFGKLTLNILKTVRAILLFIYVINKSISSNYMVHPTFGNVEVHFKN